MSATLERGFKARAERTSAGLRGELGLSPWGWSAVTIVRGDSALIIFNPRHSAGRQASDITHELSHVILGHQPATMIMSPDGSLVMRSYDQKQEDEANWLAWAILLPREALLSMKRKRATVVDIATAFGVTETLVQYRLRITGIESQLRATTSWRGQR